jgi:hypothetical protein
MPTLLAKNAEVLVTMDMGPVVEAHNRCAFQLANEA